MDGGEWFTWTEMPIQPFENRTGTWTATRAGITCSGTSPCTSIPCLVLSRYRGPGSRHVVPIMYRLYDRHGTAFLMDGDT
jgi:hypothetical protein